MYNPNTQQEDPNYVDPNSTGIINAQQTPAGIGTTPINAGSVSSQLDAILGTSSISESQGQAKTWDVTKDQTVQGQVAGIIDNKNLSPLMERAQAGAMESANSRGLINSSMAVQSGQAAVLDAATGIATQDAATYADAAKTNAGFGNQYGLATQQQGFNVENMNQEAGLAMKMYDAQLQGDLSKMAAQQGYNLETMTAQQVNDLAKVSVLQGYDLTKMDKQAALTLQQMDAQQLSDLAKMAKAQGYNLETMTVQQINDLAKATVLQGFDLAKMDKDAANALSLLDASTLADMKKMAAQQGYNLETLDAQQINDLARASIMQGYDLTKMDKVAASAMEMLDASTLADIKKMTEQNGLDLTKMDAQQINDLAKMSADNKGKLEQIKATAENNLVIANLDNANRIQIADIQGKYSKEIAGSNMASNLFTSTMQQINNIQQNKDMTPETKQASINQAISMLEAGLGMASGISGMDIGSTLDFTDYNTKTATTEQTAWDEKENTMKTTLSQVPLALRAKTEQKLRAQLGPRPT